jgi:hypothetical protein
MEVRGTTKAAVLEDCNAHPIVKSFDLWLSRNEMKRLSHKTFQYGNCLEFVFLYKQLIVLDCAFLLRRIFEFCLLDLFPCRKHFTKNIYKNLGNFYDIEKNY